MRKLISQEWLRLDVYFYVGTHCFLNDKLSENTKHANCHTA